VPRLAERFSEPRAIGDAIAALEPDGSNGAQRRAFADAVTLWRHGVLVEPELAHPGAAAR